MGDLIDAISGFFNAVDSIKMLIFIGTSAVLVMSVALCGASTVDAAAASAINSIVNSFVKLFTDLVVPSGIVGIVIFIITKR